MTSHAGFQLRKQTIHPSPAISFDGCIVYNMNRVEDLSVFRPLAGGSFFSLGGDPAADSPTATLLRLNPPCEIQVRTRHDVRALTHTSLGWFDGRCVQGAGTYSPRYIETRLLRIPASRGRVTALDPN